MDAINQRATMSSRRPAASPARTIRALERGLDVLQAVRAESGVRLRDLHVLTGLPKATLLRVLKTLADRGLVWQRMADGAYLASAHCLGPRAEGIAKTAAAPAGRSAEDLASGA